jgi:DNA-binding NarL/FixJ family response regulator
VLSPNCNSGTTGHRVSDQNGLEVAKSILQNFPDVKIIFLTMYADAAMLREAKKIGAHGYILKNSSKKILLEGIQKVTEGGVFFDESLDEKQVEKDDLSRTFSLTQREREIVRYVVEGLDSYQIAEQMSLSYLTIKTHRRNIHFKLGTSSTSELIRFARENGI